MQGGEEVVKKNVYVRRIVATCAELDDCLVNE